MAVVGTPIPSMIQVIIVRNIPIITFPLDRPTMADTSSVPIPVVVIIHAIIPATQQAIPTDITDLAPAASDLIISVGVV